METSFLQSFVLVAETGSIAEASRRLGVTPAAIAQQLRALEHGVAIAVGMTDDPSVGVDTPEDAVRFESLL